jgi:DNA primase
MFPLHDNRGNIVGFSGRILPWTDDGKSGKYINSPETPIYHKSKLLFPLYHTKDAIRKAKKVIVVEGELDALASIKASVKNVVAVKGTAFTTDQVKLLSRYADTIILSLDSDTAGVTAAKRSIPIIQDLDLNIRVLNLKDGKDPDEIVKKNPSQWRDLTKKTIDIYDFFLEIALDNFDTTTVEGKKSISKEFIPILNQIKNNIIQDHYIKKFAQTLNLDIQTVKQEMQRIEDKAILKTTSIAKPEKTEKPQSRLDKLLTNILSLIIKNYDNLNLDLLNLDDFPISAVTQILSLLIKQNPKDIITFSKTLAPQLQNQFDLSFLKEEEDLDSTHTKSLFTSLTQEIAKISLRDKLSQLRQALSKVESQQDKATLEQQINDVLLQFRSYQRT